MSVIKRGAAPEQISFNLKYLLMAVFLFLIIFAGFFVVNQLYYKHTYTGVIGETAAILPVPAAIVGSDIVWYGRIVDLAQLAQAYGYNETDDDLFHLAFSAALKMAYIDNLAKDMGVQINEIDMIDIIDNDEQLYDQLGWSKRKIDSVIIKPLAIAQKTQKYLWNNDDYQKEVYKKLQVMLYNWQQLGVPFADFIRQHSEDPTAAIGGDLGYYTYDELPERMKGLWDIEVGGISDIIDMGDAYAVFEVYDQKVNESEKLGIYIRMLKINKLDLFDILPDYIQKKRSIIFVK